jgi:hypothetical protein
MPDRGAELNYVRTPSDLQKWFDRAATPLSEMHDWHLCIDHARAVDRNVLMRAA